MKVKILLISIGLACFLSQVGHSLRVPLETNFWEEDLGFDGAPGDEFYKDLPTGPEKLPVEILELDKNGLEEEPEKEKLFEPVVDEETIKNAEKVANKDLLNGLNRILKNNETLNDVFRTENVYNLP